MGRIIYKRTDEKGELNLVVGNVSYIRDGKSGQIFIGVTVERWNPETRVAEKVFLSISAWNNEDGRAMADRVRKAKLGVGSFASFLTNAFKDDSPAEDGTPRATASLINFQYNAKWSFGADNSERNIIVGTVARTHSFDEDSFKVTIPVNNSVKMEDGSYDTAWYGILFKNTENANMADRARKLLDKGTSCAILCGSLRVSESNGYVNNDLYGFEIVLSAKKQEEEAA